MIVLDFKLENLFFKSIKFFYSHISKFLKNNKIDSNIF